MLCLYLNVLGLTFRMKSLMAQSFGSNGLFTWEDKCEMENWRALLGVTGESLVLIPNLESAKMSRRASPRRCLISLP